MKFTALVNMFLVFIVAGSMPIQAMKKGFFKPIMTQKEINKNFLSSVQDGQIASAKDWLAKGANVNFKDESGFAAIHCAAIEGNDKMLAILLKCPELKINVRIDGATALHLATNNGHLPCVTLLLKHKDINTSIQDVDGRTPSNVAEVMNTEDTDSGRNSSLSADLIKELSFSRQAHSSETKELSESSSSSSRGSMSKNNNASKKKKKKNKKNSSVLTPSSKITPTSSDLEKEEQQKEENTLDEYSNKFVHTLIDTSSHELIAEQQAENKALEEKKKLEEKRMNEELGNMAHEDVQARQLRAALVLEKNVRMERMKLWEKSKQENAHQKNKWRESQIITMKLCKIEESEQEADSVQALLAAALKDLDKLLQRAQGNSSLHSSSSAPTENKKSLETQCTTQLPQNKAVLRSLDVQALFGDVKNNVNTSTKPVNNEKPLSYDEKAKNIQALLNQPKKESESKKHNATNLQEIEGRMLHEKKVELALLAQRLHGRKETKHSKLYAIEEWERHKIQIRDSINKQYSSDEVSKFGSQQITAIIKSRCSICAKHGLISLQNLIIHKKNQT